MGLVSNVLLGPVHLLVWTGNRIRETAEAELYDEQAIQAALVRLNQDYDRGLVDDREFTAAEDVLMERLDAARARGGS